MLVSVVVTLIIVGVLLWAIQTFIPMDAKIKQLISAVVIVAALVYVLQAFGLFTFSGRAWR